MLVCMGKEKKWFIRNQYKFIASVTTVKKKKFPTAVRTIYQT